MFILSGPVPHLFSIKELQPEALWKCEKTYIRCEYLGCTFTAIFQTTSHKLTWCWNCVLATAVWLDEEVGWLFWGLLWWSSRLHLATIHSAVSFVCTSLWLRLLDSAERPPTPSGYLPCWRGLESQCARNIYKSIRGNVHILVLWFPVTSLLFPNITLNRFMFWLLPVNTWQLSSRMLSLLGFCFYFLSQMWISVLDCVRFKRHFWSSTFKLVFHKCWRLSTVLCGTVKYQSSEFGSHELAFLVFLGSFMSVLAGTNCPSESPNPLQSLSKGHNRYRLYLQGPTLGFSGPCLAHIAWVKV